VKEKEGLKNEDVSVNLIRADLDTATAFIADALQSDAARIPDNIARARRIYDRTVNFLTHTALAQEEEIVITKKLSVLRSSLRELGQTLREVSCGKAVQINLTPSQRVSTSLRPVVMEFSEFFHLC
jgi:hypothetical protein